ncbi:MAG: hypothetical protein HKN82_19160 [Akkermansiaceae bacterium]|nr:hypothetical protein [Akkermansiaceae bacterium]NNM30495.1 hypothetical protein [Akkermansiaceae bacterium]
MTAQTRKLVQPPKYNITANSDFIVFGEASTLVPKGAILHVPNRFRANIDRAPRSGLKIWNQFLSTNRGRLMPLEITRDQALGVAPIEKERLEAACRTGRIVVAVMHGNPTSVNLPTPQAAAGDSTTKS